MSNVGNTNNANNANNAGNVGNTSNTSNANNVGKVGNVSNVSNVGNVGGARSPRILGAYLRRSFLQWLAGRGFIVTLVANQLTPPLIGLAVWTTALPRAGSIASYYVVLLFVRLLTVSYENHTFSGRIYNGELADDLLRPHPVILQPLTDNLALRLWHLLIGLPLLLATTLLVRIHLDAGDVALALPALLLAAVLQFLFTYLLALSAFWTERAHGIVGFGTTLIFLLGGVAAPLALFPPGVRAWGQALPFRAMLGFPVEVAVGGMGRGDLVSGYLWQAAWTAAFALGGVVAWRWGVRRYTAVGG